MTERTFVNVKSEGEGIKFIKAKDLKENGVNGEVLQGTFIDLMPNPLDERKLDFKFETEDGEIVVVNGAGNLGYSMKFVELGEYVQICYHGMTEIAKGPQKGRMAHSFTVNREDC